MGERHKAAAVERELRAVDVLAGALAEAHEAYSRGAARSNGGELQLIDELLGQLDEVSSAGSLPAWLAASAGPAGERRDVLGDVLGSVARRLAHTGEAPREGAAAEAWRALAAALDLVYGSGVRALGRLPFISDALLELLVTEARQQLPAHEGATRPAPGPPGRVLASLAVSPKLREAVATAFGCELVPTYDAVYLCDPPGSHVRTHVDTRDYELVFHLILEHTLPRDGSGGSALIVHLAGEAEPRRLEVEPGEAVALRGRGTIHSWEPLRDDEHRMMTAIGFASTS
jgi:hypothetical protein